jgi:thiol-disulfide isomerase/thioredoxin
MNRIVQIIACLFVLATSAVRGEGVTAWIARDVVDRQGNTVSLGDTLEEGRYVVFVFWQSWCASCKKEAPEMINASRRYASQAQFIGVVSGPDKAIDEGKVDRFIRETGLSYPQVRDKDLALTRAFDVKATPTIVVVAPDGRIVYRDHHAPKGWSHVFQS